MLVATQASIGLLLIGPLLVPDSLAQSISRLALVLLALGLFASVLHLGRPQLAWRAWMGWRTSWLSREVIAFALFFTALSVEVSLSAIVGPQRGAAVSGFGFVVDLAVLATGIAGLLSSVLVYSITGRPCWSFARTFTRFSTTAIVLGTLLSVALAGATAADAPMLPTVALASLILLGIDLAIGAAVVRVASRRRATWVSASRRLLLGPLRSLRNARIGLDLAAGLALLLLLLLYESTPATSDRAWISALAIAAALFAVASQWIERHLFFVASVFPRMPGRTKP